MFFFLILSKMFRVSALHRVPKHYRKVFILMTFIQQRFVCLLCAECRKEGRVKHHCTHPTPQDTDHGLQLHPRNTLSTYGA